MKPNELTAKDRPDKTGIALLQALHILREIENHQVLAIGGGASNQEALNMNPHHPYAWGLFKKTLLEATKDRKDLKKWSPELFRGDMECPHCKGEGKNEIPHDHPTYKEHLLDTLADPEWYGTFNDGDPLWWHCTPCQGSGILTELDQVLGK